jgi:aryl-alcohol dehydrogenase-like predicted oxidoreductase
MLALAAEGLVPRELAARENPLDFLIHAGGASDLADAAYRFARDEPGANVILFGTGDRDHLRRNVKSLTGSPLPESDRATIRKLFGHLIGKGLTTPERIPPAGRTAPGPR